MSFKDKLVFDTTDADTLAASDKVGAYVYGADGTLISHTTVSGKEGLDVNIINSSVAVSDGGGSLTVDAVDLDIRNLTQTDEITVFQGTSPWVIGDGGSSITVDATDLDIRNLDYSQDNVAIKGSTGNQLVVNADGSINVQADISVVTGSDKAEDSAHASGDIGTYILGVRQDVLASSTSADGDYASLKTSAAGALYVNLAESSASITVSDAALANTAIAHAANLMSVANTAESAVASPLASRKYLSIYNQGNQRIYVGGAGVSAATGFPMSPGSVLELRAGAAVDVKWVGANTSQEIRTLELS